MSRRRRRSKEKPASLPEDKSPEEKPVPPVEASPEPELELDLKPDLEPDLEPTTEPEPETTPVDEVAPAEPEPEHFELEGDDFDDDFDFGETEQAPLKPAPIQRRAKSPVREKLPPPPAQPTESAVPPTRNPSPLQKANPELVRNNDLGELEELDLDESREETISPASEDFPLDESVAEFTEESLGDEPADEELPETPLPPQADPVTPDSFFKAFLSKFSLLEKISVGIVAATLVVLSFWGCSSLLSRLPESQDESQLDFPIKGKAAILADMHTYWRAPVREGASADDRVSDEIELLPYIELELDPSAKNGALRILFINEKGDYAGDSTTLVFSNGKFAPTETSTAKVQGSKAVIRATTGLEREGDLISYLADDKFRWRLIILESNSKERGDFGELLSCPISPNRKDIQ